MSLIAIRSFLIAVLLGATAVGQAGTFANNGEPDETFGASGTPGRVPVPFDEPGSALTDFGINAMMDDIGRVTTVAMVDINNPDPRLVGIGLRRNLFDGTVDPAFQTSGERVRDAGMTTIVDSCFGSDGRITVAGMAPGANGSAGEKDLALARFNADGSNDNAFSGDGFNTYSFGDTATDRDEAINHLVCLGDGSVAILGWFYSTTLPTTKSAYVVQVAANGQMLAGGLTDNPAVAGADVQYAAGDWDGSVLAYAANFNSNARIGRLLVSNGSIGGIPGAVDLPFSVWCPALTSPSVVGIAKLTSTRYAASVLYRDGGNVTRHALANVSFGETPSMSCQTVDFGGAGGAAMTPPLVIANRVFVGLGFQPFGSGAISSRARAYVLQPNETIVPDLQFGSAGMSQWYFGSGTSNPNDDRSFIQRMMQRDGFLYAVGTRHYNGNDVDAALTRLGGRGPFNSGFEDPDAP